MRRTLGELIFAYGGLVVVAAGVYIALRVLK